MSSPSDDGPNELSEMIGDTHHAVWCTYYDKFISAFAQLEEPGWYGEIPLPVLSGIAQAFAELSGCRVVLHAFILEPIKESPGIMREVGTRELLSAEP